ncbi:MAG TPA: hypothetical protein VE964_09225 [Myxococcales bacterium]|nr:hypothetical protein [Myxococcales bacterium]
MIIGNVGGSCALMSASRQPRNWATLDIQLADQGPTGFSPPAGTGSFTIVPASFTGQFPAHWAVAAFDMTGDSCQNLVGGNAVSGTVTLTSKAGGAYAGSFDLIFDSGDHVTGTFAAAHCAGIETFFMAAGNNALTCG